MYLYNFAVANLFGTIFKAVSSQALNLKRIPCRGGPVFYAANAHIRNEH